MASTAELTLIRGNSKTFVVTVTDQNGDPFPVDTYGLLFELRKDVESAPVLSLNDTDDPDSFVRDQVDLHKFKVVLKPSQSADLSYTYKYKVVVFKGNDSENYTAAHGTFIVTDDGE